MDDIIKLIADGYAELQPDPSEKPVTEDYDPAEEALPLHLRLARGFDRLGFKQYEEERGEE